MVERVLVRVSICVLPHGRKRFSTAKPPLTDALCCVAGVPTLSAHPSADVEFPPLRAGLRAKSAEVSKSQRGEQTQLMQSNSLHGVTGGAQWGVAGLSRGSGGTGSNSRILSEHVLSPVVETIDESAAQHVGWSASTIRLSRERCAHASLAMHRPSPDYCPCLL